MIIVKTRNGDMFVNDKETCLVNHDKKNETVLINGEKFGMQCAIEKVEQVVYVSDAQPIEWKDTGSEIERLNKNLEAFKLDSTRSYMMSKAMRTCYLELRTTLEDIFETLTEKQREQIQEQFDDIDKRLDAVNKDYKVFSEKISKFDIL